MSISSLSVRTQRAGGWFLVISAHVCVHHTQKHISGKQMNVVYLAGTELGGGGDFYSVYIW